MSQLELAALQVLEKAKAIAHLTVIVKIVQEKETKVQEEDNLIFSSQKFLVVKKY